MTKKEFVFFRHKNYSIVQLIGIFFSIFFSFAFAGYWFQIICRFVIALGIFFSLERISKTWYLTFTLSSFPRNINIEESFIIMFNIEVLFVLSFAALLWSSVIVWYNTRFMYGIMIMRKHSFYLYTYFVLFFPHFLSPLHPTQSWNTWMGKFIRTLLCWWFWLKKKRI